MTVDNPPIQPPFGPPVRDDVRPDPDVPFFSARLTPYRSLGPRGFATLMIAVAAISFVGGVAFWMIGAWPVVGFFGLDLALVWVAFRLSYRQARAFEEVHVSVTAVRIVRSTAAGRVSEVSVNPAWARLAVRREEDEGVVGVALVSHGRAEPIGGFLNPPDRESFAAALGRAIDTARRGGPSPAAT
jgi:uncharacterized membrane protein